MASTRSWTVYSSICYTERNGVEDNKIFLWTLDFFFSVNKQINDKERIAAAMENPNLKKIVEECILDAN